MDRLTLDQALKVGLLQARSLSKLEQGMDIIALSLDVADDKEGEKDLDVATNEFEANEAEVVEETIPSHEATEAKVFDEAARADAEARDEDLPITPATDADDKEDDDEDDDNEDDDDSPTLLDAGKDLSGDDDEDDDNEDDDDSPTLLDAGKDLSGDDDEDDDDDDFTI
ncbi:nonsense-mediated mRNA decay protein 2-like [Cynara cardunculus var. scolymus]|uniref:nonsense-mediated mRNA decay protein 2-like n=1 Tax=Cynara cardunculus var. scolymus TaxID=59895 RepID=UPI000D62E8BB|nr:nonsense-mediated mRNA decay protein 2-like [Cynara cardunculus var. scolymus]